MGDKTSYRVLIADDNGHVRDILANGLARAGHRAGVELLTTTVTDGEEAWRAIQDGGVDLVVVDFYMPNEDGGSLLQRVRKSDAHRALPVLVISSEADRKNVALARGADAFLDKPLRLVDVADTVRSLLRI